MLSSVIQQIAVALRFYATGSFQQVAGDACGGMHKATVSRIVKRVITHIASLARTQIHMPVTEEERRIMKFDFAAIARFPE